MKHERDSAEPIPNASKPVSNISLPPCKRRMVNGKECGLPTHLSVIEEIEEVYEYKTILLRFPCFDFFRNVHLCETSRAEPNEQRNDRSPNLFSTSAGVGTLSTSGDTDPPPSAVPSENSASSSSARSTRGEVRFAPEALQFVPHTLETDTPIAVLNFGTANEMIFEGQWCEVVGDGTAVSNRAVVHLCSETAQGRTDTVTSAMFPPSSSPLSSALASPAATAPAMMSSPVASLLPHAGAGVTADEERRLRTEELKGWAYDRVDVPSAVLVMQRVR